MYSETQLLSVDDLVVQYSPLVRRIAHHLVARLPASVQVDDMVQAGIIGLIEAARKFELGKGATFETFAGIRIRGAMLDEIRRGDWAPRSVHRNARRVSDAIRAVEQRTGRDARDDEVAAELQLDVDTYYAMMQDSMGTRLFSLQALTTNEDGETEDFIAGPERNPLDGIERDAMQGQLAAAIRELPEKEQLVLSLYYEEELNLREIGEVLGVSESRISQIHSQATHRLRARLASWRDV